MGWIPTDQEVTHWLGKLRAGAPGWGVLYDPGRRLWMAVRGRRTLLLAYTPGELVSQITAYAAAPVRRKGDTRVWQQELPPGVTRW